MKSIPPLCFFLFGAAFALSGCGRTQPGGGENSAKSAPPPPAPATESATARIAYQPIVFGLPVFVAEKERLFEKRGVAEKSISFNSANDMIAALVAGQVDLVPGAPLVPVLSLESKYPGRFRVFAHSVMTFEHPFDEIVVKKDSPIKSVKDLEGKKLALIVGTTATSAVKAYLKQQGVDPSKVEFLPTAPTNHLAMLESGAADALYAYEPTLTIALAKGARPITPSVYCSLQNPCALVVAIIDRKWEKEHPEAAKRAIEAFDDAFKEMRADPTKAAAALIPTITMPTELAPRVSVQQMTIDGKMDLKSLQQFIDVLRDIGEIKDPVSAEKLVAPTL